MVRAVHSESRPRARKSQPKTAVADAAARRELILEAAARLFDEKGIAATTVRDIGDAAGVLSGSLYYHFSSKEAIVEEIVRRYLTAIDVSYQRVMEGKQAPRTRFEGLVRASFEAIAQHRHACSIYQNECRYLRTIKEPADLQSLTERVQSAWLDTIRAGVRSGSFRKDIDTKLFYRFARDSIWFTVRWHQPDRALDIDALTASCTSMLLDGFGA